MKYAPGDTVVCRSDEGVEGMITPGKRYEVQDHEHMKAFLRMMGSNDLLISVMCDDGHARSISKLLFMPDTETIFKKGSLEVVRAKTTDR